MPADLKLTVPQFTSFTKSFHHSAYLSISPQRPELSAKGKNVVITGGGTGIGKGIAIAFAQAGARTVTILGRREVMLQSAIEGIRAAAAAAGKTSEGLYAVTDLTKREQVDKALRATVEQAGNGKISILVSNAGSLAEPSALSETAVEDFMDTFETNVRGALNLLQAFLPYAAADAVLINVSTGMAHMAPVQGMSAYHVGKAANLKMVDCFAEENPNIRVVSIHPGLVQTDLFKKSGMDSAAAEFDDSKFHFPSYQVR
jgi:NAD(P)-dependent dehydrogenase (short-subunit alcohol dehydrogenase family)